MADPAKIKKKRGGHRGSVTKMVNELEAALAATPTDLAKVIKFKRTLEEKVTTIKDLDEKLLDSIDDEGTIAAEIEQSDEFLANVYAALHMAEEALRTRAASTVTASASRGGNTVRLPKLSIHPFSGDITQWTSFWDSFKSSVHSNSQLSPVDKFNYLRSFLTGPALEAIAGLALSDANYTEATTILEKRFGNRQQIISKHMDELLSMRAVSSDSDLIGLRQLYDSVETHIRGLRSLGVTADTYGSLLSSVFVNKLPVETRVLISRQVPEASWSLEELLKAMLTEIEARERVVRDPRKQRVDRRPPCTAAALVSTSTGASECSHCDPSHSSSMTLVAGSGASGSVCCYCNQGHSSQNCTIVTQPETRKQILQKQGRCYTCTRTGHRSRECRTKWRCRTCNKRHHTSICTERSLESRPRSGADKNPPSAQQSSSSTTKNAVPDQLGLNAKANATSHQNTSLFVALGTTVLLQTATAVFRNPEKPDVSLSARAILDLGSQRSYITRRAATALTLSPSEVHEMSVFAFGSSCQVLSDCELVHATVDTLDGAMELSFLTVPTICEPLNPQLTTVSTSTYEHLSGLRLADNPGVGSTGEVEFLIGSDHYWELATGRVSRGSCGPIAVETKLGWVLSGPLSCCSTAGNPPRDLTTLLMGATSQESLDATLRTFWELESFGITEPSPSPFENNISFVGGRYEVQLPWKSSHPLLPDNFEISKKRLWSLLARLRRTPKLLAEYDAIISNQLDQGVIQPVQKSNVGVMGHVHYLPHHAVIKQEKTTTKIRIVYDASAKGKGPSLNDCLLAGPSFNQRIFDILVHFRTFPIALTADIEKAFLNVSVCEEDRDVLRFLWLDDIKKERPEIVVFRFARVVFGITSSPFLLNATIDHHLESYSLEKTRLVEVLKESIYVDDIVTGSLDEDSALNLYKEAKDILRTGGFNLRKFVTNSPALQRAIDQSEEPLSTASSTSMQDDGTYAKSVLGGTPTVHATEQKVLGVRWNVVTDNLIFGTLHVSVIADARAPTKRTVTEIIGKFFDPLGYLSPVVVTFKMFFKELCEEELDWDQELTGKTLSKWERLLNSLREVPTLSIPRMYAPSIHSSTAVCSLHGFCDASVKAYAAVIYLVTQAESQRQVSFVASKTRISPQRELTVPRLELLSALLLARLIHSVTQILSTNITLQQPVCYADSQVALHWIAGHGREWKQFVRNRVTEICKLVPAEHWKHCPGADNPADLPSRGMTVTELSVSRLWNCGPKWLGNGLCDSMCTTATSDNMPIDCLAEMKCSVEGIHSLIINDPVDSEDVIQCKRYSSLSRLLAVTAYVLKFIDSLKRAIVHRTASGNDLTLTTEETRKAETLLIRIAQRRLPQEKHFLLWRRQFDMYLDDDKVWRCRGRIHHANVPQSARHPVMLPRDHYLTRLIVLNAHARVHHSGTRDTIMEIRSRYWIVRGRSLVRMLIRKCVVCRRIEGSHYQVPPPPPLPDYRVREAPPFAATGIDYAGPFYVRYPGRSEVHKVWLCLFTCAVVRAVHLELVPDMSACTFLRCLKRFVARRGVPNKVISDNALTFKAANDSLQDMLKQPQIQQYLRDNKISWVFNLERAPWWGGLFERMIKVTKRCLRKVMGQASLYFDELSTLLVEIEAIINSRPLSHMSSEDLEEPITPSHFLCGRRILSLPDDLSADDDLHDPDFILDESELSRRMRYLNTILNHFWERWKGEYLLALRETHRYHGGDPDAASPSVGDIVVVEEEGQSRCLWRLARIDSLITGKDGRVRGAVLHVPSNKGIKTLQRPLQHLYPLEVTSKSTEHSQEGSPVDTPSVDTVRNDSPNDTAGTTDSENSRTRPSRAAAREARDRLVACALSEREY